MGDRASSLSIASTSLSNAGNYTCVAQNAAGMDYHSTYLEVNGINLDMTTFFFEFIIMYWLLFIWSINCYNFSVAVNMVFEH